MFSVERRDFVILPDQAPLLSSSIPDFVPDLEGTDGWRFEGWWTGSGGSFPFLRAGVEEFVLAWAWLVRAEALLDLFDMGYGGGACNGRSDRVLAEHLVGGLIVGARGRRQGNVLRGG